MKTKFKNITLLALLALVSLSCSNQTKAEPDLIIGVQTYSFRTMEDQSPLAVLEYIKQTGVKNIELMGNHAEPFAGAPESPMNDPAKRAIMIKQWRKQELTEKNKS